MKTSETAKSSKRELPDILGYVDPNDFTSRQANIRRTQDSVNVQDVGPAMNFPELMKLRKAIAPNELKERLEGPEGFTAANVGISLAIDLEYGSGRFALAVYQDRPDFGDGVLKLLSGYRDANHSFLEAAIKELGEELIVVDDTGVLRGELSLEGRKEELSAQHSNIEYLARTGFHASAGDVLTYLPSLDSRPVETSSAIRMMYHAPTSSGQMVMPVHLTLKGNNISLYHSEDKLKDGMLEVCLDKRGIVLLEMTEKSALTGNTYRLVDGKLERGPETEDILLSEAFATPVSEGIVNAKNVPFKEYLERQQ